MSDTPILRTSGIRYAHGAENQWAFDDIELRGGDHLLILGKSGSGKTTLLNLLCGLLRPDQGEIFLDGLALHQLKSAQIDQIRGKKIGLIFQRPHFIKSLNVRENIELPTFLNPKEVTGENAQRMMDLGIDHLNEQRPNQLSEGEKQRVGIARALAQRPSLLLADEPTSALDDDHCQAVIQLLIKMAASNQCALIVVTHDERVKSFFPNQMTIEKG